MTTWREAGAVKQHAPRVMSARDARRLEEVQLRAKLRHLELKLELLRECCRPGLEEAPDGPQTFLRAARKILEA